MPEPPPGRDWERLQALYHRAAGLSSSGREALLGDLRNEEPEFAERLETLLSATGPGARFFESLGKALFSGQSGARDPVELIPHVDPLFGTTVGPYRIDTIIGRGGMGIVYKALHTGLDEPRAIKFLPSYDAARPEMRRRFIAEARVTAAVTHPNVGEIYEVAESADGRLYLAMPYYEGVSLRERLKDGALPVHETLDWFRQACAGLVAVHAAGIIHRDVKPGNLLRTTDGIVKVLDFGLAKIAETTLGTGGRSLGTLAYMSPEQLRGDQVDDRTDSWSLGVVLHEMLWGERPFGGSTTSALKAAILDRAPVVIPQLPAGAHPAMGSVLGRLLARDPADRPALGSLTSIP